MRNLTTSIRQKALGLGFCKVGIAKAERVREEELHLHEWLNRGYHATMSWMARNLEKRVDPRVILPDAKSVISVAMNYYTPFTHSEDPSTGKISRYAWGDDYHGIVEDRLGKLLEYIKTIAPDAAGKAYVDTGPMMDKFWAEKSGIGWEGKHTNVITQEFGSWFFLGEMILNLELEYDTPATDHCGECTLCIEACPTGAIVEPYVVDANKCISYVTIEHRGEIAHEIGANLDRWVYGCDVCQDVCPWNHKFSKPTSLAEFAPREQNKAPILTELAEISQEEFSSKYKNSPIKRTKAAGLRRNAQTILHY